MLKNLFKVNLKWLEVAFYAGAAAGTVFGSLAGLGIGFALGNVFATKSDERLPAELAESYVE